MADKFQYWSTDPYSNAPAKIELRSTIALNLVEKWGAIAAKPTGEDSTGRAMMGLQEPEEFVNRCFEIADLVVNKAEERGELRPNIRPSPEPLASKAWKADATNTA